MVTVHTAQRHPFFCATVPSIPTAPTSTVVNSNVIFHWSSPSANGTPILGYRVYFRKSDDTFAFELTYCDGSNA